VLLAVQSRQHARALRGMCLERHKASAATRRSGAGGVEGLGLEG
jgi:hypothetical protein